MFQCDVLIVVARGCLGRKILEGIHWRNCRWESHTAYHRSSTSLVQNWNDCTSLLSSSTPAEVLWLSCSISAYPWYSPSPPHPVQPFRRYLHFLGWIRAVPAQTSYHRPLSSTTSCLFPAEGHLEYPFTIEECEAPWGNLRIFNYFLACISTVLVRQEPWRSVGFLDPRE